MMFKILDNGRENFTDNVTVAYMVKLIPKRYNSFLSSKVFKKNLLIFNLSFRHKN
jgi:hypothetical protein